MKYIKTYENLYYDDNEDYRDYPYDFDRLVDNYIIAEFDNQNTLIFGRIIKAYNSRTAKGPDKAFIKIYVKDFIESKPLNWDWIVKFKNQDFFLSSLNIIDVLPLEEAEKKWDLLTSAIKYNL